MLDEQAQFAQWMTDVSTGSESAFASLYRAMHARLRHSIRRWSRDAGQYDEVLNDTFLQAWRTATSYSAARGTVFAWLCTIAHSRAIDGTRRTSRRREFLTGDFDELQALLPTADDPIEFGWTTRCDAAFGALCAVQRQVLLLSFAQGRSHEEIALHVDLPLGTVKSHARRGLASMAARLRDSPQGRSLG